MATPDPNRILTALNELTGAGNISSDQFIRIASQYPDFISREAVTIINGYSVIQESPAAKEFLRKIVEILEEALTVGIERALISSQKRLSSEERERRFAHLRDVHRQERFRPKHFKQPNIPQYWQPFSSLGSCVKHIRSYYSQELVPVDVCSVDSPGNTRFSAQMPRYFFRGESGIFPSSLSSLHRVGTSLGLPVEALEDVLRVTIQVRRGLEKKWRVAPLLAVGLLQHYGMPTEYLDVTSDLNVAVCFASDLRVGEFGALCVAEGSALTAHGKLVDLRSLFFANRPNRQQAFGFTSETFPDLKSITAIEQLGVKWCAFRFTEDDARQFEPNPELLDAHSDRAAGLIELIINGYGKMHDAAAMWISNRLQPAPFVLRREKVKNELIWNWISAEDAGVPHEETASRKSNYELWSNKFRPWEVKPLPEELHASVANLEADSNLGATLRVVGSRVLDILQPDFGVEESRDPLDPSE